LNPFRFITPFVERLIGGGDLSGKGGDIMFKGRRVSINMVPILTIFNTRMIEEWLRDLQ